MSYALELKDLRKNFGKTEIIRGANLAVNTGERVAIIGPNGAGKSTLFNLISGRFGPTSGEILLNGQRIENKTPYEINRLGLSRSFQITNIFPKLSVFENLRCAVLWSSGYKYTFLKFLSDTKDANDLAEKYMEMLRLDKKRDLLAMNLTYAEQRALEIGVDALLLAKSGVDGVYSADPRKDKSATKFEFISYDDVLSKSLAVADAAAFSLCRENKLPIIVFNLLEKGNIARAVRGEPIGTLVN